MLVEEDSDITSNLVTSNTIQSKKNNISRSALPPNFKKRKNSSKNITNIESNNGENNNMTLVYQKTTSYEFEV